MKPKQQLQAEAEERRAAHERRTPEEQLRLIAQRRGSSLREAERLRAEIAEGKPKRPAASTDKPVTKRAKKNRGPRTGKDFFPTRTSFPDNG